MTETVVRDRANKQLVVTRTMRGTSALVWACWTQPRHLRQWWGPRDWRADVFELDLRPGGVWRYRLRPDHDHRIEEEHWGRAVYESVDPHSSLTFLDGSCTPEGTPIPGTEMPTRVSIEEREPHRCEVSIIVRFPSVRALDQAEVTGMVTGFTEALRRLDEHLQSDAKEARP